MDFHGIDLNLLVAFDALMNERNVTRAAARVGVSQPAMSAALARLRNLFGDPLFRRNAEGLQPTPRARELTEPIANALHQIETALVRRPRFVPEQASMAFTLGMSDYPAFVLLPPLMQALSRHAPGVTINVYAFSDRDDAVDLLDAGTIDAAVGVPPTQQESRILTKPLLRDEFVTVLRKDHPAARRGLTLKAFLELQHVLVSPEGNRHGLVDQALATRGQQRQLGLTMPQMFSAPAIVAATELAATLPRRVALHSAARRKLVMFPPPVALPDVVFDLIWHRRNDALGAQQWLRELIGSVANRL